MDMNTFDVEELDLYDQYMKFANRLIRDELKITNEQIEPMNINKPLNEEEWVFTVKKFSYNKEKLSKIFNKYLKYQESIHTIRVMSYQKWKMMIQRDKKLHELLKNKYI